MPDSKKYVLAKKKQKNTFERIFNSFCFDMKRKIYKEMENFYPSYLIEHENKKVLLIFNKDSLDIYELKENIENKRFIFNGYEYVKANEIKL